MHAAWHPVDAAATAVSQAGSAQANWQWPAARGGFQFMHEITHTMGEQRLRATPLAIQSGLGRRLHQRGCVTLQQGCFDVSAAKVDADGEP